MGNYFVTKTITYESSRDLPVEIAYNDSVSTLLAKQNYTYDSLGRVVSRTQTRDAGTARSDAFGYNSRSELTSATLGNGNFVYNYDNTLCKGGKDLRECLKSLVLDNVSTRSCKERTIKQLEFIFDDLYKECAIDPLSNLKIK